MKPKELFVGALVCAESPSGICEVKEILSDYWIDTKGVRHNYELTEPISLTPEILLHNGFENDFYEEETIADNGVKYRLEGYSYREEAVLVSYCDEGITSTNDILDVDIAMRCIYVHQLQHVLRLCGIDKEITL